MTKFARCSCRYNHCRRSKYRLHRLTCHQACRRRTVARRRVYCPLNPFRLLNRICNTRSRISMFRRPPISVLAHLGRSTVLVPFQRCFHNSYPLSLVNNSLSRTFCSSSNPQAGNKLRARRLRNHSSSLSSNSTNLRLRHSRSLPMRSRRTSRNRSCNRNRNSSRRCLLSRWRLSNLGQSHVVQET